MIRNLKHNLTARFAACENDVKAAQRLRFQVFYKEMSALADSQTLSTQLDKDIIDTYCDHILIIDHTSRDHDSAIMVDDGELLGTYRVLTKDQAASNGGFYAQTEFDIASLVDGKPHLNCLELGRSCVAKHARSKPVLELLWQEIWNHTRLNHIDVLFGCASLEGVQYHDNELALRYLIQNHQAPKEWLTKPLPTSPLLKVSDQPLSKSQQRQALAQLPALIKSYLKVGAFVSPYAVVDFQFNVTDVLVMLPVQNISNKYRQRFDKIDQKPENWG